MYDDGEAYHAGLVHDLSDTGVFLETRETLPVGAQVHLSSLELDDAHGFDLSARVVRVVEQDPSQPDRVFGMGLEFQDLTDEQRIRILALIERFEEEASAFEGEVDPFFGKSLPRAGLQRAPSGVWREGPSDAARPPPRPTPRESSASASKTEAGDGDADGESDESSMDVPILEPVLAEADVHFEAPVTVLGSMRESTWPSAPWRKSGPAPAAPPAPKIERRLFDLAQSDIGSALDQVVDDLGQPIDDVVLVDEDHVSPFLLDAQLMTRDIGLEDDHPGHEPLDADAFARDEAPPGTVSGSTSAWPGAEPDPRH